MTRQRQECDETKADASFEKKLENQVFEVILYLGEGKRALQNLSGERLFVKKSG